MRRRGAIIKNMPQVGAAAFTDHFCSLHAQGIVFLVNNAVGFQRFKKTGPSAAAGKFGVGPEQGIAANCTVIAAFYIGIPVLTRKWPFSGIFPGYSIKIRWQYSFPFSIGNMQFPRIRSGIVRIFHWRLFIVTVLAVAGYLRSQDQC